MQGAGHLSLNIFNKLIFFIKINLIQQKSKKEFTPPHGFEPLSMKTRSFQEFEG